MFASILSIPISVGRGLIDVALEVLATWVASGTVAFLDGLARALSASTSVSFGAGFAAQFELVAELGAVLALPLLVLTAIQAVLHQDLSVLLRTVFVRMPLALTMGAAVVGIVHLSLEATDAWSAAMLSLARAPVAGYLRSLAGSVVVLGSGGGLLAVLVAGLATVGALGLWVELAIRTAAIAVATLFTPLALCGLVLPQTAHLARRLGEILAALILAKPVIAAVLAFSLSTIVAGGSVNAVVEGIAVLGLAALAPFALLRLIPLVEAGAIAHLEGLGRRASGEVVDHAMGAIDAIGGAIHANDGYDPVPANPGSPAPSEEEFARHYAELSGDMASYQGGEVRSPLERRATSPDAPRTALLRRSGTAPRKARLRMTSEWRTSFRFGSATRPGIVLGAGPAQLTAASIALVVALAMLRALGGLVGVALALVLLVGTAVVGFVRVGGSTPAEWAKCAVRFTLRRPQRRSFLSSRRPPRALAAIEVVAAGKDHRLGLILDRRNRTETGLVELRGENLALLGAREREQRAAAWGRLLAAVVAGGGVHRLQWIERTVPDRADAVRAALAIRAQQDTSSASLFTSPALSSYEQLLETLAAGALRHECLLALSVRGGTSPVGGGLPRAIELLTGRAREAGVVVERILGRDEIEIELRSFHERLPVRRAGWPWPIGLEEGWSTVKTDGVYQAAFWIEEWPRSEVGGDFLLPLLLAGERRAVAVTLAPVSLTRARREVAHARTSARADAALRARHGFLASATTTSERGDYERRDRELAEGHQAFRFSGHLLVTANDPVALEESVERLEQAGALAHLSLRRLYGCQIEGLLATLPLGRGCA